MKIDVEGAEYQVLKGATAILERDRPVILCEVLHGYADPDLGNLVGGHGYRFFLITADGLRPSDCLLGDPSRTFLNYLLVPDEQASDLLSRFRLTDWSPDDPTLANHERAS